jgi:hypothetical protein
VAAASYGDLQATVACESHGGCRVGGAVAAGDKSGVAVNGAVPYSSDIVVIVVVSGDELARNPLISIAIASWLGWPTSWRSGTFVLLTLYKRDPRQ